MVFLKLKPYRQASVKNRTNPKLCARYYGPYEVFERIGEVAYRLKLPATSRIHLVFHVSLLKKAHGEYPVETELLLDLEEGTVAIAEPEAVLEVREVSKGGKRVIQWLVSWKGQPSEEATWEDEVLMRSQFPELKLEDKQLFLGGGIDRDQGIIGPKEPLANETLKSPREWIVYTRRKKRAN